MQFNRTFLETGDTHPLWQQQDAHSASLTGDWMNLTHYNRAYIMLKKWGSESSGNSGLQLLQAQDNLGTGVKALTVGRCWYKSGTMTAQGVWTAVTFNPYDDFLGFGSTLAGGSTYATTVNARAIPNTSTNSFMLIAEVLGTDLDEYNGFDHVTAFLDAANLSGAMLTTAEALLWLPNYAGAIPQDPTL